MKKILILLCILINLTLVNSINAISNQGITNWHLLTWLSLLMQVSNNTTKSKIEMCTKITDSRILAFLNAQNNNNLPNVKFYYGHDKMFGGSPAAALENSIIWISKRYYKALSYVLHNNKKRLSENETNLLKMIKFLVKHELNHLKNQDIEFIAIMTIASAILKSLIIKYSGKKINSHWRFFALMLTTNIIERKIIWPIINQYQEYRADNIGDDMQAIQGGKISLKDWANTESFGSFVLNLKGFLFDLESNHTHPTFKDRLKKLEELEAFYKK